MNGNGSVFRHNEHARQKLSTNTRLYAHGTLATSNNTLATNNFFRKSAPRQI